MKIITAYNYDSFVPEKYERWMAFDESPAVGSRLPDFTLRRLDGEEVSLRSLWRDSAYTVMEFGSFT